MPMQHGKVVTNKRRQRLKVSTHESLVDLLRRLHQGALHRRTYCLRRTYWLCRSYWLRNGSFYTQGPITKHARENSYGQQCSTQTSTSSRDLHTLALRSASISPAGAFCLHTIIGESLQKLHQ